MAAPLVIPSFVKLLVAAGVIGGGAFLAKGVLEELNTTGKIVLAGGALYLGARLAKVI